MFSNQLSETRTLIFLLAVTFVVTGCFGEFEEPITNDPYLLVVRLGPPPSERFGTDGEHSGYTFVVSAADAETQGIQQLEQPLIADFSGIATTSLELTNTIHPTIADKVIKPCFDDPVVIREDASGETVLAIENFCPTPSNKDEIYVAGVLGERPLNWALNNIAVVVDTEPVS